MHLLAAGGYGYGAGNGNGDGVSFTTLVISTAARATPRGKTMEQPGDFVMPARSKGYDWHNDLVGVKA